MSAPASRTALFAPRGAKSERRWKRTRARGLLPDAVTMLGTPGKWILEDRGELYQYAPRANSILAASADGRTMYLLRPIRDAGPVEVRQEDQLLHVEQLWRDFTNRRVDGYYNVLVPPFAMRPQFRGRVVLLRYRAQKDLDDDSEGEVIEWEHYFEAPHYPDLFMVGGDQYVIAPGNWRVTSRGIEYHRFK